MLNMSPLSILCLLRPDMPEYTGYTGWVGTGQEDIEVETAVSPLYCKHVSIRLIKSLYFSTQKPKLFNVQNFI